MKLAHLALVPIIALSPVGVGLANASLDCGQASWYALNSKTASGEQMNPNAFTAAHRKLRFGTKLKVTNPSNGRSVVVRINDRGPFAGNRVLDLSKAAAREIGIINQGHARVCMKQVG